MFWMQPVDLGLGWWMQGHFPQPPAYPVGHPWGQYQVPSEVSLPHPPQLFNYQTFFYPSN
jgi:hypothetical protein